MKKIIITLAAIGLLASCTTSQTTPQISQATETPSLSTPTLALVAQASTSTLAPASQTDFFTQNKIAIPAPVCNGLTQQQGEGPYYTPNTPQRNSLLDEGTQGTKLILVGYVLDQNCQPLANAWLDFWQADANGNYDNVGYALRGHQFTDSQGRYYLETIFPGLYQSRPIEHIHVKIKPEGGAEAVTSQLYFPQQPVNGLTVVIEERDEYLIGYFDFVVRK